MSKDQDPTDSLGNPFQPFITLIIVIGFVLLLKWDFNCLQLVPISPSTGGCAPLRGIWLMMMMMITVNTPYTVGEKAVCLLFRGLDKPSLYNCPHVTCASPPIILKVLCHTQLNYQWLICIEKHKTGCSTFKAVLKLLH